MSIDTIRSKNSLDKLLGAVASEKAPTEKKSYTDERIWKGELDKSGNGYAVLRFLPAIHGEELPWVKMYSHAFQGPTGQWYIENSRTTINQKDPVSEYNSKLWNTGLESDKEIARKQKRKLSYYSNVYVVSDPKHPNNEGKVFLFKYGKKIYDKLLAAMQPEFQDETPVNPFDPFVGANFKLKIRKVDGYWNYDKSEFEAPSKLFEDEAKVEETCQKAYALSEFSQSTNFKSYEELQKRMDIVLSGTTKVGNVQESIQQEVAQNDAHPQVEANSAPSSDPTPIIAKEEDDTMSYFEKLANS